MLKYKKRFWIYLLNPLNCCHMFLWCCESLTFSLYGVFLETVHPCREKNQLSGKFANRRHWGKGIYFKRRVDVLYPFQEAHYFHFRFHSQKWQSKRGLCKLWNVTTVTQHLRILIKYSTIFLSYLIIVRKSWKQLQFVEAENNVTRNFKKRTLRLTNMYLLNIKAGGLQIIGKRVTAKSPVTDNLTDNN